MKSHVRLGFFFYENTRHPDRFLFLHTKNERVANKPLKFKDTGEPELWYSYTWLGETRENVQYLLEVER